MKLLIASDIHGSAYYCEQLVEAFHREGADKLFLLGDILYHGPRNDLPKGYAPKQVIAMLNPLKDRILCVRGNCEAEVDQMVLEFPVLTEQTLLFVDDLLLYATHGHHQNPENPPCLQEPYVLLNGHTHLPAWQKYDGFYYCNPGSVSIPKENTKHSYILLENRRFTWKDLSGTVYRTETL